MFWNGSTAIDGLSGNGNAGAGVDHDRLATLEDKDMDWPGDILQLDLASVREGEIELVSHLLMHRPRQRDATGIGNALDARRNVDAVAHQVVALHDNIANVDADAQGQSPERTCLLDRHRAGHRLNCARKLDQEAIADRLEQSPGMLRELRLYDIHAQTLELSQGSGPSLPMSFE
jgi:hypothetical protein